MSNVYATWTINDLKWVVANKLSQAQGTPARYSALKTAHDALFSGTIGQARHDVTRELEGDRKCGCDECALHAFECEWFLEMSQPLAEKEKQV